MVKVCSKCKVEKPLTEFYKRNDNKSGFRNDCKSCKKKYQQENKELISERMKKWRQDKKEHIKAYKEATREHRNEWRKQYRKQKRSTDTLYKLKCNLRVRTQKAFKRKGYSKNTKTQQMLGVEWGVAKQHIERQFTKGMNWNNYGEWHIDHIIPLSSAKTPERLKQLCHYTNLQPLWAEENLSKKDIINGQQTLLRI